MFILFPRSLRLVSRLLLTISACVFCLSLAACGGRVIQKTEAEPLRETPEALPEGVPLWLGNPGRNYYGTGPWPDRPLEVIWEFETKLTSGRLHKEGWGGSSWPGQPSVSGNRVYFGSADGYLYCLNKSDGSLVWQFKAEDSLKTTPTLAGDRIIASGLDHYVYCLNAHDGSLIWKYKTGFEVDCSAAVIDGRVYFGGEDGFFYVWIWMMVRLFTRRNDLDPWKAGLRGGPIYIATEQGNLLSADEWARQFGKPRSAPIPIRRLQSRTGWCMSQLRMALFTPFSRRAENLPGSLRRRAG